MNSSESSYSSIDKYDKEFIQLLTSTYKFKLIIINQKYRYRQIFKRQ